MTPQEYERSKYDLAITDEDLVARLRAGQGAEAILFTTADRIEALNAKLAKATDVLREILFTSNEDHTGNWLDALARGQALMAELDGTK